MCCSVLIEFIENPERFMFSLKDFWNWWTHDRMMFFVCYRSVVFKLFIYELIHDTVNIYREPIHLFDIYSNYIQSLNRIHCTFQTANTWYLCKCYSYAHYTAIWIPLISIRKTFITLLFTIGYSINIIEHEFQLTTDRLNPLYSHLSERFRNFIASNDSSNDFSNISISTDNVKLLK